MIEVFPSDTLLFVTIASWCWYLQQIRRKKEKMRRREEKERRRKEVYELGNHHISLLSHMVAYIYIYIYISYYTRYKVCCPNIVCPKWPRTSTYIPTVPLKLENKYLSFPTCPPNIYLSSTQALCKYIYKLIFSLNEWGRDTSLLQAIFDEMAVHFHMFGRSFY